MSNTHTSAAEVVQRQVDAYNRRDLDAFVSTYGEGIAIFRMPSTAPMMAGKVQLAEFYATKRFKLPLLRAEIVNRIVLGNKVVDQERIWGVHDTPLEIVVVYEVIKGLIERVWFFAPE